MVLPQYKSIVILLLFDKNHFSRYLASRDLMFATLFILLSCAPRVAPPLGLRTHRHFSQRVCKHGVQTWCVVKHGTCKIVIQA